MCHHKMALNSLVNSSNLKMKKKRQINSKLNFQKITLPAYLNYDNPHIKTLTEAQTYEQQVSAINFLNETTSIEIVKIFTFLYITTNKRLPLRVTLARHINKIKKVTVTNDDESILDFVDEMFVEHLNNFFSEEYKSNTSKLNDILLTLWSCIEEESLLKTAILYSKYSIFKFAIDNLLVAVRKREDALRLKVVENCLKIVEKCVLIFNCECCEKCVYEVMFECLTEDEVCYEAKNCAAAVLIRELIENGKCRELYKCSEEDIIKRALQKNYVSELAFTKQLVKSKPLKNQLFNETNNYFFLLQKCIDFSLRTTSNATLTQDTATVIQTILSHIQKSNRCELSLSEQDLRHLLDFLWADFDGNRQICKKILEILLETQGNHLDVFADFLHTIPRNSSMYNALIQLFPNDYLICRFENLPTLLLEDLNEKEVAALYECLIKRFHSKDHSNDKFWWSNWIYPVLKRLSQISDVYENLLIVSFELCPIIANILSKSIVNSGQLSAILKFAETKENAEPYEDIFSVINERFLEDCLFHKEEKIRLSALKLLIKTNVNHLQTFLTYNSANISTVGIKELVGISRRIFKEKTNLTKEIFRCLMSGLEIDANHNRRSVCLEILATLSEIIEKEFFVNFWLEEDIASLIVAILHDRFEANQKLGMNLIGKFSREKLEDAWKKILMTDLIPFDENLQQITNADPYTFEILLTSPHFPHHRDDILPFLITRSQTLPESTENHLPNYLSSIRHFLHKSNRPKTQSTLSNLLAVCLDVYRRYAAYVSSEAPEGAVFGERSVVAWRSVKEASLLLGEVAVAVGEAAAVGDVFHEIFAKARHRGVFEQAYFGFERLCEGCWRSNVADVRILPGLWLDKVMKVMNGDAFCATRRSAGLPFFILAIITTEPEHNTAFHKTIKTLLSTPTNPTDEEVIHRMNILRAIFRNNRLGEVVHPYISPGLTLSIENFKSKNFAVSVPLVAYIEIRNSAALLFAALLIRIFGVQRTPGLEELSPENLMSAQVFFRRFPNLKQFFTEEIQTGDVGALQPIFVVLCRLTCRNEASFTEVSVIWNLIEKSLGSEMYHIRKLAAEARVALLPYKRLVAFIEDVLKVLGSKVENNFCQGLILQLKYSLKKLETQQISTNVSRLMRETFWILINTGKSISYHTSSMFMEILQKIFEKFRTCFTDTETIIQLFDLLTYNIETIFTKKGDLITKSYKTNLFSLWILLGTSSEDLKYKFLPKINQMQHISDFKKYLQNFAIYYGRTNKQRTHAIYRSGEIEIPRNETETAENIRINCSKKFFHDFIHTNSNNLKNSENIENVLLFYNYPCLIFSEKIDDLLECCFGDRKDVASVALNCVGLFYGKCSGRVVFGRLLDVLWEFSDAEAQLYQRLSVCEFLWDVRSLVLVEEARIPAEEICQIFNIILILLEDDDPEVRNLASELSTKTIRSQIPEKTKEGILDFFTDTIRLPLNVKVDFLLRLLLKEAGTEINLNTNDIFRETPANLYKEPSFAAKLAVKWLRRLLEKEEIRIVDLIGEKNFEKVPKMLQKELRKIIAESF